MQRKKVSLGTSNRPTPTSGYVRGPYARKQIGNRPRNAIDRNEVEEKTSKVGFKGGSPPLKGVPSPPYFSEPDEKRGSTEILVIFRQLDRMEQRAILAKLSLELQNSSSGEDARDADMWGEAVYEAVRATLGPSDGAGYGPQVIRRLMGSPTNWAPISEFIANARLTNLRPAEKFAVYRLLAKLLVDRAKRVAARADIPLTAKLVAQNAQHIAGIFDNAFPGYLANGLVGSVSRMLISRPTVVREYID